MVTSARMMSNNHQRYQTIGQELNLGNYRSVEVIQSLWGGYGELVRVTYSTGSVIIKHVKTP